MSDDFRQTRYGFTSLMEAAHELERWVAAAVERGVEPTSLFAFASTDPTVSMAVATRSYWLAKPEVQADEEMRCLLETTPYSGEPTVIFSNGDLATHAVLPLSMFVLKAKQLESNGEQVLS